MARSQSGERSPSKSDSMRRQRGRARSAKSPWRRTMTSSCAGAISYGAFGESGQRGMHSPPVNGYWTRTLHDRHGIVTRTAALLAANHYLTVMIDYLFAHRPRWRKRCAVGKTIVSTQMIDRVAARLGRTVCEVPVGFKWFVEGLGNGSLGFAGEESAGASFLRVDGNVWTTDKDGIVPALLGAEITQRIGRDPGEGLSPNHARPRRAGRASRASPRDVATEVASRRVVAARISPYRAGGRKGAFHTRPRTGQPRTYRRPEGDDGQQLVCRATLGYGEHLQDLRRKLPRRETPGPRRGRGPGHGRCCACPVRAYAPGDARKETVILLLDEEIALAPRTLQCRTVQDPDPAARTAGWPGGGFGQWDALGRPPDTIVAQL